MPCGYVIDTNRSMVLSRAWGILEDRELLAHARALGADASFQKHLKQVIDFRDVTEIRITAAAVREMAHVSPFGKGARRALVVSSDLAFGLTRMFQILREQSPDEVAVFREMDVALRWLGVAADKDDLLSALSRVPLMFGPAS